MITELPNSAEDTLRLLFGERVMIPITEFARAHGVHVATMYRQRKKDSSAWPRTSRLGDREMVHVVDAMNWYRSKNFAQIERY